MNSLKIALFIILFPLIYGDQVNSEGDYPDLEKEFKAQYKELKEEITQKKDWYEQIEGQIFHPASAIHVSDRTPLDVVIRRTDALIDNLNDVCRLNEGVTSRYEELKKEIMEKSSLSTRKEYQYFLQIMRLKRNIAFQNPLLDFEKILFTASHSSAGDYHMCDQYYGIYARPGGSIFVLDKAFSSRPKAYDMLEGSNVANGRLKGRSLKGGMFLFPELSWDGKKILFSYSECGRDTDQPTPLEANSSDWTKESSFHVFRVDVDGSNLVQLTDGGWNDVHPCWLPDGRILFISERRGGFLRCSGLRPCPNYTLHAMESDGSKMVRISHHETNEWHPSISNDGKILYTRWDYVDRGDDQAHHPWITSPDGRDPRAIHGNYKYRHQDNPDMEVYVRAIPGSHKYVALAAPHHGGSYGSLIVIDPKVEDDDAMAPVKRLTPEDGFPESRLTYPSEYEAQKGKINQRYTFQGQAEKADKRYSAAFPLSENYYLTTRDKKLYLIDAFGNRELIWEVPGMYALGPVPIKARTKPPIIPAQSIPVALTEQADYTEVGDPHPVDTTAKGYISPATVSVMDVYNSLYPYPDGTQIKELRIIQVLQKTTPIHQAPAIGFGMETGARKVLGTVPVEEDGSAYFYLPSGKSVYFQSLDEHGQAVQSMMSATYAQGGEHLSCIGCHEKKGQSPQNTNRLALQRPPSVITPEPEGSNPLSYPRLVQPVLDMHCIECHNGLSEGIDLTKGNWRSDENHWYTSYRNLHPYTWHRGAAGKGYDLWNVPRSFPGELGARSSKLMEILRKGHYDVNLTTEEWRRLSVWIDANSDFFGAYKNTEAQAEGQVTHPELD